MSAFGILVQQALEGSKWIKPVKKSASDYQAHITCRLCGETKAAQYFEYFPRNKDGTKTRSNRCYACKRKGIKNAGK